MDKDCMKILHLTVKKKWFDMIASGEKKEEYRDIKPYWVSRLVETLHPEESERDSTFYWKGMLWSMDEPVYYTRVKFKNGYGSNAPSLLIECNGIETGFTKLKWADEYKCVFIISLGKIITYG